MSVELIKPKDVTIIGVDGEPCTYTISRFPYRAGRKIAAVYPVANLPKLMDYNASEEAMMLLMRHIERVTANDYRIRLTTGALIDNHIPDPVTGLKLEAAILAYNFDFFGKGGLSSFLAKSAGRLKEYLPSIIPILMELLPPSVRQDIADGLSSTQSTT